MSTDSDLILVEATLDGDQLAFEKLVLLHQRAIVSLIIRITGNINDAPDIAQKVFLKAYTKLSSFQRKAKFKTWLFSIAINLCRNELRQKKRWGIMRDVDDIDLSEKPDLVEGIEKRQRKAQLESAMDELPPKQRLVLDLRINEELSFAEISKVTGISENSAKVNFHHAVKKLKNLLSEE
jgi:RNA polymerase sigma-70 factor (ECF subfamily)